MASWLGKDTELIQGAADQAFKPSGAPAPLGADPTQDCLNTCNDRYQKDLDNPSVDYMEAQKRYTDCKASCGDVGAIPSPVTAAGPPPTAAGPPPVTTAAGFEPVPGKKTLACIGGICKEVEISLPENIAACKGKKVGDPCSVEPFEPVGEFCKGGYKLINAPYIPGAPGQPKCKEGYEPKYDDTIGWTWCCPTEAIDDDVVDGEGCEGGYILSSDPIAGGAGSIWTDETIKAEHGWYRDPNAEGHRVWHKDWGFQMIEDVYAYLGGTSTLTKSTSGACKKGFKQESINGEAWCCPSGDGDGGVGGLGEYGIPGWLQELLDMLMGRGKELLDPSQYGYSQEAMDAMFGRGFEKVRGQAGATRETIQDVLSRSGFLGTGAETSKMAESAWETERGISDLQRDLMIKGEEQRKKDLLSHTGLAQDIFSGAGIGSEAFREMMNIGRRGERQSWFQMLLDYFQNLKY